MLRPRQQLGKYRIVERLAQGGFANVYKAYDTIEGIHVALKIPHSHLIDEQALADFRKEVRLVAQLDHPNVLTLKNASFIDGRFVIVYPLGEGTLADRLRTRRSIRTSIRFAEQMLEALAYAHGQRVLHCDVKPENFIVFPGDRVRLTDFGIARFVLRTIKASGSGTVGYIAPEQAMGKPSFRSDVFSLGLVLLQMFSGHLPEWPYAWPPPGFERLRRNLPPEAVAFLRRSIEVQPKKRYEDAQAMLRAFRRFDRRILEHAERRGRRPRPRPEEASPRPAWQAVRHGQFLRAFKSALEIHHHCEECGGPIAETMTTCPWCGVDRPVHHGGSRFPGECPRCHRGMKLDWRFCPWCYGPGFDPGTGRAFPDVRYVARCANPGCPRKDLMPFMRYCPWCRRKVRRRWTIEGMHDRCSRCGWGIARGFWDYCPWCARKIE